MGFWFYMLVMTLLLPTTLTVIGAIFRKTSPRDINMFVGYRTRRSMLSKKNMGLCPCLLREDLAI